MTQTHSWRRGGSWKSRDKDWKLPELVKDTNVHLHSPKDELQEIQRWVVITATVDTAVVMAPRNSTVVLHPQ